MKPANVMLRDDGEPMLTDFGLAARAGDEKLTADGHFLGTPAYCAPEQWRGNAGPASDMYSLGCLLFELLTGRTPFKGSDFIDSMVRHTQDAVPRLPGVSPDLETVVRKCLEKDPARRYADCAAAAEDLRRWLAGESITARRPGPLERVMRWARREPVLAGMVAAVLAFAVAAGWLARRALHMEAEANARAEDYRRQKAEAVRQERIAEGLLLRTRHVLYAGRLTQAQVEWDYRSPWQALNALDGCAWDVRGWEHAYLWSRYHGNQVTLRGHAREVTAVAVSPDGARIASASGDGTVRVWDAATGRVLRVFEGPVGEVTGVAFSPDGTRVVSGGNRRRFGRVISSAVTVYAVETGEALLTIQERVGLVRCVAFSPDGKQVISGSDAGVVRLWDARTGQDLGMLVGFEGDVTGVAFSPDGRRLVCAGDRTLKVWDVATPRVVLTLKGHADAVTGVAFSPDGGRIVSGGTDMTVRVWDADTGRERLILKGHTAGVEGVAFGPEGRRVVSAGADGTLKVWDTVAGREVRTLKGHAGAVKAAAFSPDGRRVVSGGADGAVKVWDTAMRPEVPTLRGHVDAVWCVAVSPDGGRVVSSSADRTVKVWDADGREVFTLRGHAEDVTCVAISADGTRIVSGDADGVLKLWDAATGRPLTPVAGHEAAVRCVAFSRDGRRVISGSEDGTAKVWDAASGREVLTLKGHTGEVWCVTYGPDGRRVFSGSVDDTLKVWDATTGQELLTLREHTAPITSVAVSADGRRVVSGSRDHTVKVRDAGAGPEVRSLLGHIGEVKGVDVSPDGQRVRSVDGEGRRLDFDTTTGEPIAADDGPVGGALRVERGWRVFAAEERAIRVSPTAGRAPFALPTPSWHHGEASDASPFARAFHLERLHRMLPHDPHVKRRLDAALAEPGTERLRELHRAFACARAAAAVGSPGWAVAALVPR